MVRSRLTRLAVIGALVALAAGCARIRPPAGASGVRRMVVTTGYCPCGSCTGWRRTWYGRPVYASGPLKGRRKEVGRTASGTQAKPGTIAADTSLYPFGTIIYVPGYGYGVVEDRGSAITGPCLDLFFRSHSQAERWGRKAQEVLVWFPPRQR